METFAGSIKKDEMRGEFFRRVLAVCAVTAAAVEERHVDKVYALQCFFFVPLIIDEIGCSISLLFNGAFKSESWRRLLLFL